MNWEPLIAVALAIWGWALPFTIVTATADVIPPNLPAGTLAWSQTTVYPNEPHPTACTITVVAPRVMGMSNQSLQNLVTHEVGHCLGLDHISQPGIMFPAVGYEFSGYDRLEFWHHYPAPYRITIPGVSN